MATEKLTHAQKDQIIADLEAKIGELTLELAAKPATPAQAADDFKSLGSVSSDLLFLGGREFSENWAPEGSTSSEFALDFHGPDAEKLAKVAGAGQAVDLGDGVWRVMSPNRQYAQIKVQQVKRSIVEQEMKCTIVGYPKNCTRAQALDASREGGFGFLRGALVLRGGNAALSGKFDANGKLVEVRVKL